MTSKIKSNFKNKNGFTLAEVLITLVIVGVISAMTIPTLINKTQDQELKSQFVKAYSIMSQAVYKTEMNDFAGYVACYYPKDGLEGGAQWGQCAAFYNALVKNLQVQKVCKGNALSGGCIPVYKKYHTDSSNCPLYCENGINVSDYSYVLSDGQIIILWGSGGPLFLVDINGHKGPNAPGKDLFSFELKRTPYTGLSVGYGGCQFTISGGRSTQAMILYSLAGKK